MTCRRPSAPSSRLLDGPFEMNCWSSTKRKWKSKFIPSIFGNRSSRRFNPISSKSKISSGFNSLGIPFNIIAVFVSTSLTSVARGEFEVACDFEISWSSVETMDGEMLGNEEGDIDGLLDGDIDRSIEGVELGNVDSDGLCDGSPSSVGSMLG